MRTNICMDSVNIQIVFLLRIGTIPFAFFHNMRVIPDQNKNIQGTDITLINYVVLYLSSYTFV